MRRKMASGQGLGLGMEGWLRDLRQSARGLWRAPAFSLAVFLTLALCLGPNVALVAILRALLVKPLPFPEPQQLVQVVNVAERDGGQWVRSSTTQFLDFRDRAASFAGFATVRREGATLDEDSAPRRVALDLVSAEYFALLGVQPARGRWPAAEEFAAGREPVLVVSHSYWTEHYAGDPGIVGRVVRLGGQPHTIVGVAPRELAALDAKTTFFKPYLPAASRFDPQSRYRGDLTLYARLRPGVTPEAGRAELAALESAFRTDRAAPPLRRFIADAGFGVMLEPLRGGGATGGIRALWLLQAGALLVLLIGAVNVVNLFLARLNGKRTELAVRVALGADRAVLFRRILTESLCLTGAGTAAGLALGACALQGFNRYLPLLVPAAPPVSWDPVALLTILGAALGLAGLVALLPWCWVGNGLASPGGSRSVTGSARSRWFSGVLVVTQVALAVLLLAGAGLLARSFAKVLEVEPGFDASRVVQARVALPSRYRDATANVAVQRRILEEFRTMIAVEHVAISHEAVLDANLRPVPFGTRVSPPGGGEAGQVIHLATVSPDFFRTLGLSVVSGRGFEATDDFAKQPVAVVSEAFARRHFPAGSVEGQEIHLSRGLPLATESWARIVGVVNAARFTGLDRREELPTVFVPMIGFPTNGFQVLVRSPRPTAELVREMRARLHAIDPSIPLYGEGSLRERLAEMLLSRRGITALLGAFALLALTLAALGLYGVLAYDVSQRTREIGIRGALGATPGRIVRSIVRRGMSHVAAGAILGGVGAAFLTRSLESWLFGIGVGDAPAHVAVLALGAAVTLAACWLPARRAAKVDPMVALRAE